MKKKLKKEPIDIGCYNNQFRRAGWTLIIAVILFFIGTKILAQQNLAGPTGGFNSVEYYPAPAQMQIKSRLSGADAQPLEGGLLDIKQLRLEMFATNGQPQVIVTAPECIYDVPNQLANSPGKLSLQNGDGKIHAEGEGFLWRQNDSSLTISNNVKTVIASYMLAAANLSASAQTNLPVATNSMPSILHSSATAEDGRVTHIDSDNADFDLNARTAIYRGDVRVTDPQMKLTCAYLIADLPQSGQINHIVAETNVVIDFTQKDRMTHATGEKAVYDYKVENGKTNEMVTLTGSPQVESAQGNTILTNTADVIVWNRLNNSFRLINPHTIIQNLNSLTETNLSPENTNQSPAPK